MIKDIKFFTEMVKGEMDFRRKLIKLIIKRNEAVSKAIKELEK